jgi:periplasmic protein TonB
MRTIIFDSRNKIRYYINQQRIKSIFTFFFVLFGLTNLFAQNTKNDSILRRSIIGDSFSSPPDSLKVYLDPDVKPQFQGNYKKYLSNSIKYPEDAMKKKIEGTVYLNVIIEKNGAISNIRVLRSPDTSLSNEAKRVVSIMPRWTPGKQNGVPVRVNYLIPVHFKL